MTTLREALAEALRLSPSHRPGFRDKYDFKAERILAHPAVVAALADAAAPSDGGDLAATPAPAPADRAELFKMWTAGEKLAYGCGYRDGRALGSAGVEDGQPADDPTDGGR